MELIKLDRKLGLTQQGFNFHSFRFDSGVKFAGKDREKEVPKHFLKNQED